MGENKWTDEQLAAITGRGGNLLVAAAAGAGKTAVLVERIIRKITDEKNPVDIDRLLVVTFTNAAASEMRERIGDAISKSLDKSPESKILQRQMALLNKASITTIHSFCLDVIRNNFHIIGLDPGFRIADATECTLMKQETAEELFNDMYEPENINQDFERLIESFGGNRDDSKIMDIVLNLYEFVQSCPHPEDWLKEKAEDFNPDSDAGFEDTKWGRILIETVKIEMKGLLDMLSEALRISEDSGLTPYGETMEEDMEQLKLLEESLTKSWDQICEAFVNTEFGKLKRCGKDADKAAQEEVKKIRDEVKKAVKKMGADIFSLTSQQINEDIQFLYPMIRVLSFLAIELGKRFGEKKREKSVLDFNDLEHLCLKILSDRDGSGRIIPSKTAEAYREKYEEVMVDEYQDSNLVQEEIISLVSRSGAKVPNTFMVGDIKQSIYRFRQARPDLFKGKYDTYSDKEGSPYRKILLFKNFRSRKGIVDSVNFIFRQIMSENIGELSYDEKEALIFGADYNEAKISPSSTGDGYRLELTDSGLETELHVLNLADSLEDSSEEESFDSMEDSKSRGNSEMEIAGSEYSGSDENGQINIYEDEEEVPDSVQSEAILVAKRIKELMPEGSGENGFKVFDKRSGGYKGIEYRDIVILLRTTKNWAEVFVEELANYGIPAFADSGTGYFKTMEIQIMMSLLQIIDNPMQDIPFLSVLRSPVGGFNTEDLIDLRLAGRSLSFYEAMKKFSRENEGDLAQKSAEFLKNLDDWRNKALYMRTDELIWFLYGDTGYYGFAGAMPGGLQRQANLKMLFERARQYEDTSYKGLFNFISFINKMKSSSGDLGSAKVMGENENVVRIMSIHKSKGLEFPVVFVSGCGKRFNMQDMNKSIMMHQELGFGPDFVDYEKRISYPSVPKQALRYKLKVESLSEEMRILYVAFTRAREKLIITGSVKNLEGSVSKWSSSIKKGKEKPAEYERLKAKNYLDWIGPALMYHENSGLLRELADIKDKAFDRMIIKDESKWNVTLWTKNDLMGNKKTLETEQEEFIDKLEDMPPDVSGSEKAEELNRRLYWQYADSIYTSIPAKISVTELKRLYNLYQGSEEDSRSIYLPPMVKKPKFMLESKGLTAAEKGSALHFFMQHIDIGRTGSAEEIKLQMDEMAEKELMTKEQLKAINGDVILRFFNSDIGKRLKKAPVVKREVPFNLKLNCSEVYTKYGFSDSCHENLLMQGVIDCFFIEEGEAVLIDYKTDRTDGGDLMDIKERYSLQLDYYEKAIQSILKIKVKEKYIYLFSTGDFI